MTEVKIKAKINKNININSWPFSMEKAELLNIYMTNNLIRFRFPIHCYENNDKFRIGFKNYIGKYYIYDLEVRDYKILDCLLNAFTDGWSRYVKKLSLDNNVLYLEIDNDTTINPFIKLEAKQFKLIPIAGVDIEDNYLSWGDYGVDLFDWQIGWRYEDYIGVLIGGHKG